MFLIIITVKFQEIKTYFTSVVILEYLMTKTSRYGNESHTEIYEASVSPLELCVGIIMLLDVSQLEILSFRKRKAIKTFAFWKGMSS